MLGQVEERGDQGPAHCRQDHFQSYGAVINTASLMEIKNHHHLSLIPTNWGGLQMTTAISTEDVCGEVEILKALSRHKNLVKFHDPCEDANYVYLTMKIEDELLYLRP